MHHRAASFLRGGLRTRTRQRIARSRRRMANNVTEITPNTLTPMHVITLMWLVGHGQGSVLCSNGPFRRRGGPKSGRRNEPLCRHKMQRVSSQRSRSLLPCECCDITIVATMHGDAKHTSAENRTRERRDESSFQCATRSGWSQKLPRVRSIDGPS